MNKMLTIVLALLLLAALLTTEGCGSSTTGTKSSSMVTVTIGNNKSVSLTIRPATLLARAELQLRRAWRSGVAVAGIPAAVKKIVITVSAPDMTTITRTILVVGQLEITDTFEVPNGTGRHFKIEAFNSEGRLIYFAEASRDVNGAPVEISFDMRPNLLTVTPVAGIHGNISPATAETVVDGSTKQFTITADSGYSIVAPVGGTCPQGNLNGNVYTTGIITTDCTVAPAFSAVNFVVSPVAGTNGSISPANQQTVASGSVQQFTIVPDKGFIIEKVSGCGGSLSGATYTTAPLTGSCTVTASFIPPPPLTYTVTPIAGHTGAIVPSTPQEAMSGSTQQFTIVPNSGYLIGSVSGCGGSLTGNVYTTGPITGACTVLAGFVRKPQIFFTVTPISPEFGGTINPDTPQPVLSGATIQFSLTPDIIDYFLVTPIGGTCPQGTLVAPPVGANNIPTYTYTTGAITADCTVAPVFSTP
jgi:hypothetical protein